MKSGRIEDLRHHRFHNQKLLCVIVACLCSNVGKFNVHFYFGANIFPENCPWRMEMANGDVLIGGFLRVVGVMQHQNKAEQACNNTTMY